MKAEITESGIELYAESQAERWALQAMFPPGTDHEGMASRIIVHSDPEDSKQCKTKS